MKPLFSLFLLATLLTACTTSKEKIFSKLENANDWQMSFSDDGTSDWSDKWFLDGERASVSNTDDGMTFAAGPELMNDTCHAVLWTKQSFDGDVKIEYDFTRNDSAVKCVNIIYIQAVGKGEPPYVEDISEWNDLRVVPHMSTYFKNMDALHVSYAAFSMKNTDPNADYIRVRRYPVQEGASFSSSTEVAPSFFDTNFFKTGEVYHLTYVKTSTEFYMQVQGADDTVLYHWDLSTFPQLKKGRIGFRHMYTRTSTYKNIRVYER